MPLARITKLKGDSKANVSVFAPSEVGRVAAAIGGAGTNTHLTGVAFGYIGQESGKFLAKRIKKLK